MHAAGSVPWRMSGDGVESQTVLRNSLVHLPSFSSQLVTGFPSLWSHPDRSV